MSLIDYSNQASTEAIPGAKRSSTWIWISATLLAVALAGVFVLKKWPVWSASSVEKYTYVAVKPATFNITIKQNGELQSVDNIDINCPVAGQNTIQQIVPEGSSVKKGDVIAELDSTEHRRNLESAQLELEKSEGDVKWAREQLAIQQSSNAAALNSAQSDLALAEVNLREYTEGSFPSAKKDAERKLEMANIKLKRTESDFAATKKLFDNNFVTVSEVQKAELEVVTAKNEQEKAASDVTLLTNYTHLKDEAERRNKLTTAQNKVAQVQQENASNFSQKQGDLRTKERQLELRKAAMDRAQKNFDGCTIKAPSDGMVLYASSVNMNYYREQPIQVGAKIFQEQMLIRLPDISKMKTVVMVRESRVMKLRQIGDVTPVRAEVAIVGIPTPIGGVVSKIGVLPDNSNRYMNPDAKDYPVDITLDQTPPNLKPGTSAQVVIYVGRMENVLSVPLASIYSAGDEQYVFVRDTPDPKPVKVKVGEANETSVQIIEGLEAGRDVALLEAGQGRALLDLAGIKVKSKDDAGGAPTSRPAPAVAQPSANPAAPVG